MSMRPAILVCGAALLGACATTHMRPARVDAFEPILGTWRLVRYEVWESGKVTAPMSDRPSGYAVFDATGHAFIQLMHPETHAFGAYYGTVTIDEPTHVLTIAVEGSSIPNYVGTRQVRPFRITADTLRLGVPGEYQATLVRVP